MQIIISPAKSLDFETQINCNLNSDIRFTSEPQQIIKQLKKLKPSEIGSLMKISDKLSELNYNRFQNWSFPFDEKEIRQALFAFKGDVYQGIDAFSLSECEIKTTQNQLRILSGLYGLLRPLDLILPYRLEMGTSIKVNSHKDLYKFWDKKIATQLNKDIAVNNYSCLINLASNEYFKAVHKKEISVPIVTPIFKDSKNGQYKIISFYAKKARGLMSRFIIQNELKDPNDLKAFDLDGYYYNSNLSDEVNPVFTRDKE